MDNSNVSRNNKSPKENLDKLIMDKKRAITSCLNMQCRNEQLKVLIEKLNNLANQREHIFNKTKGSKLDAALMSDLYNTNFSIEEELKKAKENSKNLEDSILQLKSKIQKINESISQKP